MKQPAFFVSESEYPKLQDACPSDFPFTYKEFVKRAEEFEREFPDIIRMDVCVASFLTWCNETKIKPDNIARAQYAALLLAQTINRTIGCTRTSGGRVFGLAFVWHGVNPPWLFRPPESGEPGRSARNDKMKGFENEQA